MKTIDLSLLMALLTFFIGLSCDYFLKSEFFVIKVIPVFLFTITIGFFAVKIKKLEK